LQYYKDGYYSEPTNGFLMKIPNEALKQQLTYDNSGKEMSHNVFIQILTQMK
jgi:hypothetical protein